MTDTLSATEAMPQHIREALRRVLDYAMPAEARDYEEDPRPGHVYESLKTLDEWLAACGEDDRREADMDEFGLGWLHSDEGKSWLASAPLEALFGRQLDLIRHPDIPDAEAQIAEIEAAIRGHEPVGLSPAALFTRLGIVPGRDSN